MADYPNEYPNIGFNPAPGSPSDVEALSDNVQVAANGLAEADQLLGQLRSSTGTAWQGDAANAFRSHVNDKLAPGLEKAQESLSKAVGVLRSWNAELIQDRNEAQELDAEAAQARQRKAQADTVYQVAASNPDLGLAGKWFTDPNQLADATARYQSAVQTLRTAQTQVDDANAQLSAILKRASDLQAKHFFSSFDYAGRLRACTHDLAPEEPGALSRLGSALGHAFSSALHAVGKWVKDHLKEIHEVLSDISAVCGVLALITPPPADAIFAGVALVTGAGALACDLADPEFRHNIGQLLQGNFNKQTLGALATGTADVLSVVPGGGALGKLGVKSTVKLGEKGGAELYTTINTAGKAFGFAAKDAGFVNRGLAKLPGLARLDARVGTGLNKVLDLGGRAAEHTLADRINLLKKLHTAESRVGATIFGDN